MQTEEKSMTMGEKIAYMRKKNNMTQGDLGSLLNVSYQAVSKWERNESLPDFDMMSRIARTLGVPIAFFEAGATLASTNVESVIEPAVEKTPDKKLLGVCKTCGKAIYEGDGGGKNAQGIYCRTCTDKIKRELEAKQHLKEMEQSAHKDRVRWRKNAGFIVAAIVTALGLIGGISSGMILDTLIGSLFIFTFVAQLFWAGAVAKCAGADAPLIGSPGVIFTLDLDCVFFLIGVKLLFAILRFFIWLFIKVICILAALMIAPVTFVPALLRVLKGEMEFDD